MQASPRRTRIRLFLLVIVALSLRIGYVAAGTGLGRTEEANYLEYVVTAQRLLEHGVMASPWPVDDAVVFPSCLMPPIYPSLVALLYWCCGAQSFLATLLLQLVNALATSAVVPIVFVIARRMRDALAGGVAALAVTLNPLIVGHTEKVWDTGLFTLGIVVAIDLALRFGQQPVRLARWFAFGLYLGALALLNPALTIAYPFLVLWPIISAHGRNLRRLLSAAAVCVCGWLLVITPWTIRNYIQFNELMYVRGAFGLQLWNGVFPEADTHGSAFFDAYLPMSNPNPELQAKLIEIGGEWPLVREYSARAKQAIRDDPWRYVRLSAWRTVDYWAGTIFTTAPVELGGWPRSTPRAIGTLFLLGETLVILVGVLALRRLHGGVGWLLTIIVVFSLVYSFTFVMARYRAPIEPVIGILVATAISDLVRITTEQMKQRRSERRRPATES